MQAAHEASSKNYANNSEITVLTPCLSGQITKSFPRRFSMMTKTTLLFVAAL